MRNSAYKPVVLIIRDGWGFADSERDGLADPGNAVTLARTPVNDRLLRECPWNLLDCSGEVVGLPAGQMGNSEVGHLNLGAGRVVYQDITRISKAIREGSFAHNPAFTRLIGETGRAGGRLHLLGLCSDGGVHSHIDHLHALIDLAAGAGLPVVVHCMTDGRDTSPTGGRAYVEAVQAHLERLSAGVIATISGRYFAMDRDKRWERTEKAWRAIVLGEGAPAGDPLSTMDEAYRSGVTDEFIAPVVIAGYRGFEPADGAIFFNFRADRTRQLTAALTAATFAPFARAPLPADRLVTMTQYGDVVANPVAFPPQHHENLLADVLAQAGCTQLRIAETEKYAHVTYFFNGGKEEPVEGEERCLIPSPKVATYDLAPEMSAVEVTRQLIERFEAAHHDFVLVNYANPDMVGHTADIPATVQAVEIVDRCVGEVLAAVSRAGGTALVTSDHGNAEKLRDENGAPFTAHTLNPVQIVWVPPPGAFRGTLRRGILADVAPTVLDLLGLEKPTDMTGVSLLEGRGT
ncbi:MAG TPA: 2,3-bisphosphoglycerate-independent phosphoglycerate mutase [Acidobacteria bacterium]|nr:2,3-bisphosphoglycerate-independent phosphoglycerate mutase [Acidobacteriota bacterium]